MSTAKMRCSCRSPYQDKKHRGKRVHNQTKQGWRCTVCGTEKK